MTIMGIPIRIHFSWLIIFGLITWSLSEFYFPQAAPDLPTASYWLKGVLAALLLLISVALHELAHSFVSLHYRIPITGITLFIFGGVSEMKGEPQTPRAELTIAMAGPLSSFLLSAIFFLLSAATEGQGMKALYAYVARLNLILGIFNLIPGFPMDGGRVLRSIIWRKKNDFLYATRKASGFGQKVALFFIFSGLLSVFAGFPGGIWMMLIGWFLFTAAQASYQQVSLQEALAGVRVRDVMVRDIVTISPSTTLAEAVDLFFLRYGYGGFPVFDDGRLLGMLTLKEVKDVPREDWQTLTVADVLVPHSKRWEISPESTVMQALEIMIAEDRGRLVVTENDRVAGLITRNGIAQYVQLMRR